MSPALAAIATLLFVTVCYVALCAVSPFGPCRKCRGFGYRVNVKRGTARRGKPCRRCRGHGTRIRPGRHVFNLAARIYRDANH